MCYTMTLASYKGTLAAICKLNSINIIFKSVYQYFKPSFRKGSWKILSFPKNFLSFHDE